MKNLQIVKNEIFIEKYPLQTSIKGTDRILKQMKECICKISIIQDNKNISGTGFFCKIPLSDEKSIIALITNYHVLNKKYLNDNKSIKISLNDNTDFKIIYLDSKIIYCNKDLDITLIQINQEKEKIYNYLDIDENIEQNEEFFDKLFFHKPIYALHYQYGKNILVSYGIVNKMNNNIINHSCSTDYGSSGSPIILLDTFKVIGIHKGYKGHYIINKYSYNNGIFFKSAITEFKKYIEEKKKNILNNYKEFFKSKNLKYNKYNTNKYLINNINEKKRNFNSKSGIYNKNKNIIVNLAGKTINVENNKCCKENEFNKDYHDQYLKTFDNYYKKIGRNHFKQIKINKNQYIYYGNNVFNKEGHFSKEKSKYNINNNQDFLKTKGNSKSTDNSPCKYEKQNIIENNIYKKKNYTTNNSIEKYEKKNNIKFKNEIIEAKGIFFSKLKKYQNNERKHNEEKSQEFRDSKIRRNLFNIEYDYV